MAWLTDNVVANMRGPSFLAFYAIAIALTVLVCRWKARSCVTASSEETDAAESDEPRDAVEACSRVRLLGGLVIVGLGGYRLCIAITRGRLNVGYLVFLGGVGLVALFRLCPLPTGRSDR